MARAHLQDAFQRRLGKETVRNHLDMQNRLDPQGNRYGRVIDYKCAGHAASGSCTLRQACALLHCCSCSFCTSQARHWAGSAVMCALRQLESKHCSIVHRGSAAPLQNFVTCEHLNISRIQEHRVVAE